MHIVYLGDSGETNISYGDLHRQVELVAAGLQRAGLEPRQTVAIMLPTSPEYFFAFFGILLAGGIPVPIYPPARLSQIEDHVRRHAGILANAEASILITVPEARGVARLLEARVAGLRGVVTVAELKDGARRAAAGAHRDGMTSRSSSTPRAARAIPRAWCSRTPTCSPTSAPSARRSTCSRTTCS